MEVRRGMYPVRRKGDQMLNQLFARVRVLFRGLSGNGQSRLPDPLRIASQAGQAPRPRTVAPPAPPRVVSPEQRAERTRALAIRLFGANQPVDNPRDLFGRQAELTALREAVLDGGMHAVIYGPRGSGKTSLVRVFGTMADERGATIIYLSCAGSGDFGQIILPYLHEMGPAPFGLRADEFARAVDLVSSSPTPRSVAALLARANRDELVLILDEFDRLEDADTKAQLALLIKLLADMRSRVRLVFVGISGDVGELIDVHASVRRHLTAVGLKPISDVEVANFIRSTSSAIGVAIAPGALAALRFVACGSPYHMRLFSLQSCLAAIDGGGREVDEPTMLAGLERARRVWSATNSRDAALFEAALADPRWPVAILECFARECAVRLEFTPADLADALERDGFDPDAAPLLIEAFGPALGRMKEGSLRLAFDDVLAPQFLLSMCVTARMTASGHPVSSEGTMQ